MNKQTIILFFLIFTTGITLYLYLFKSKKQSSYKNDERWKLIQTKANNVANSSNYILIVLLAIGETVSIFIDYQITFTLNTILTYGILFIGLRNGVELFALRYLDKRM